MEYLIVIIFIAALILGAYNLYKIGHANGYKSGYSDATDYAINLINGIDPNKVSNDV